MDTTQVRIPTDVHGSLKAYADVNGMGIANAYAFAVKELVTKEDKKLVQQDVLDETLLDLAKADNLDKPALMRAYVKLFATIHNA